MDENNNNSKPRGYRIEERVVEVARKFRTINKFHKAHEHAYRILNKSWQA